MEACGLTTPLSAPQVAGPPQIEVGAQKNPTGSVIHGEVQLDESSVAEGVAILELETTLSEDAAMLETGTTVSDDVARLETGTTLSDPQTSTSSMTDDMDKNTGTPSASSDAKTGTSRVRRQANLVYLPQYVLQDVIGANTDQFNNNQVMEKHRCNIIATDQFNIKLVM